jgi:hypothetical protein
MDRRVKEPLFFLPRAKAQGCPGKIGFSAINIQTEKRVDRRLVTQENRPHNAKHRPSKKIVMAREGGPPRWSHIERRRIGTIFFEEMRRRLAA